MDNSYNHGKCWTALDHDNQYATKLLILLDFFIIICYIRFIDEQRWTSIDDVGR